MITKIDGIDQDLLCSGIESPDLFGLVCSVYTKHGIKCPELEPSSKKLGELWIVGIAPEKASDVSIPVRNTACDKVQTSRDLLLKNAPLPLDIPGPGDCCIPLLAGKS